MMGLFQGLFERYGNQEKNRQRSRVSFVRTFLYRVAFQYSPNCRNWTRPVGNSRNLEVKESSARLFMLKHKKIRKKENEIKLPGPAYRLSVSPKERGQDMQISARACDAFELRAEVYRHIESPF